MIYQDIKPDQSVEADHIHPKSMGGTDDVENLQFLDPTANRAKGDHIIALRKWQVEFLREWTASVEPSFLCVVIPGGGKTTAALCAIRQFLQAGSDRRILIVVPSINLRHQWQLAAEHSFGIRLQTKEFGTNFKTGFVGGVTTYQALDTGAALFRKICASAPTLVVLDEPHHCSDSASWGAAARQAFELAHRRLLLSGTPFRTDGLPIPFIRYDGSGFCVPDFRYDYPHALKDNVVRTLTFDYSQGTFDEILAGERRSLEFHSAITEEEASDRLRHILNPLGMFPGSVIKLAHAKLLEIRESIPDAAAMAVCMDIRHAEQVASLIRTITKSGPSVVVSDEEKATDTVDAFRNSKREWLVSVRQVSEGTDIKRLQVLTYLTNATTELIFRQLIGRVARVRFQEGEVTSSDEAMQRDLEAFVFLPADPRLIEHAKNIEIAQLRALKEMSDEVWEPSEMDSGERIPSQRIFLGSTHNGTECLIVSGRSYGSDEAARIQRIASYGITMEKAAKIYEGELRDPNKSKPAQEPAAITEEERIDEVRRKCNAAAFRYGKLIGVEAREIHKRWPPQRTMGLEQLQRKLEQLVQFIGMVGR